MRKRETDFNRRERKDRRDFLDKINIDFRRRNSHEGTKTQKKLDAD